MKRPSTFVAEYPENGSHTSLTGSNTEFKTCRDATISMLKLAVQFAESGDFLMQTPAVRVQ